MAHFNSITQAKQKLRTALLKNQNVVNLLVNTGNNVVDFEDVALGSRSPAAKFIRTYFYIPGTTTVDKNFITMRSRVVYADNNVVKEIQLVVYVICNADQIDLMQGSRADLLADEVDKILNNGENTLFGYGGIRLGKAEEVRFGDGYYGWEIPFTTHEINRRADLL